MADRIIKGDSGNDVIIQNNDASRKIEVTNSGDVEVTGDVKTTTVKATNLKANDGTASLEVADSTGDIGFSGNTNLKIKLPSAGGVYESDGSTEILTESSGTVTLKNTVIDGTVTGSGGLKSMQVFSSSGSHTWTKPANITTIKVFVTGGGGGGGGASSSHQSGGGGGAGGTAIEIIDVSSVSSVTVTVGAGGPGGTNAAGTTGDPSSFGSYCSATGGGGGSYAQSQSPIADGGVGSGGDINLNGGGGGGAEAVADVSQSGNGGNSFWGGGGAGVYAAVGKVGYTGGGGSGADHSTTYAGGAGGAGIVVVEEYS